MNIISPAFSKLAECHVNVWALSLAKWRQETGGSSNRTKPFELLELWGTCSLIPLYLEIFYDWRMCKYVFMLLFISFVLFRLYLLVWVKVLEELVAECGCYESLIIVAPASKILIVIEGISLSARGRLREEVHGTHRLNDHLMAWRMVKFFTIWPPNLSGSHLCYLLCVPRGLHS